MWALHLTLWYQWKVPRIKEMLQSITYLLGETSIFSKYLGVHNACGKLAYSSLATLSPCKAAFSGHRGERSRPTESQCITTKRESKGAECVTFNIRNAILLINLAHLFWEGGCVNKNNLSSSMFWISFSSWRSEHTQVLKQGAGRSVFHSLKITQSKLLN